MKSKIELNSSPVSSSRIRRFLLPFTILLIVLLGWLVEQGQLSGYIDTRYDSVVLAVLLLLIYSPLILFYTNRINQAEARIIRLNHLYATMSQVNQTIVRVRDRDELYQSICDVSIQFGKFALAWVGLLDEATGEVRPVAANGLNVNAWPFPIVNVHTGTLKDGLVATALRTSKVATTEDLQTDPRWASLKGEFRNYSYHSSAAIPFQLRGRTIGLVGLVSDQTEIFKDPEEIHLLEEIGLDISFALNQMETESERKLAEGKLSESEERFSKAFYQSPIAITLVDLTDNTLRDVNDALLKMMNMEREQLIGQNVEQLNILIDPEVRTVIARELQERGTFQNKEARFRLLNGEVHDILTSGALVTLGGKPHSLALMQDITESKQTEDKLRVSEARFFNAFHVGPAGMTITRLADGKFIDVNESFLRMFEFNREEAIGHTSLELNMFSLEERTKLIQRQVEAGGLHNAELLARAKSGRLINLLFSSKPMELDGEACLITTLIDITERKQAEEQLRQSEENFSKAFSSSPTALMITRLADGKYLELNKAYTSIVGYDRAELIGHLTTEFNIYTNPDQRNEIVSQLRANGALYNYEATIQNKSGAIRTVLASLERIQFNGEACIVSTLIDITERKQAEEKVKQQLQYLNGLRIIDTAISSSFDLRVTLDVVLQQVLAQLGVDAASILLLNSTDKNLEYVAGKGFRTPAISQSNIRLGDGYAGQVGLERKTIHVPNLTAAGGQFVRAELLKEEDFVEYVGVPLIGKGSLKGVLEIFHRTALHPDPNWLDFLETLSGQASIAIDNAQLFDSLQRTNTELEQRVTQRTAELNQTNLELEHANHAKDEFLATMSHELRTPLNSILGLSETLLEQRRDLLTAYQQKSLKTIASSGEHLLEMINDILDLSKIEAGKFDYYPQVIGVDDLCRSSLTFVKEQATRKSITLTYQPEASVSKIYADPRRLKQILVNLLTNAVKFTPDHGQVMLQMDGDVKQDRIQFSVTDTGIGIAPEDMKKLFKPFVQIDSRLTREYEGTGLGLALVQKLTDLQGGSVNVESDGVPGKGSRFIINLPIGKLMLDQQAVIGSGSKLAVSEPAEKSNITFAEPAKPASHGIILFAEDNVANIMTIGDYLESRSYQVVVAHDGLEAIMKAQELQPHIILMDIQMPVLNGLDAISRLRADPRFESTPIIALTALAMPGDRERCLEVGANEYLSKPVSLKGLLKTIEELLSQKT